MLVPLTPGQVTEHWDFIKQSIQETMPDAFSFKEDYLLAALIGGFARCWVMMDENNHIKAFGITVLTQNLMTDTKDLLIYHLYGLEAQSMVVWRDARELLMKYAKENGCERIAGYAANERMAKFHKFLGGDSSIVYSFWEVK